MRSFWLLLLVGGLQAQIDVLSVGRVLQTGYQFYQLFLAKRLQERQQVDSLMKKVQEGLQKLDPEMVSRALDHAKIFIKRPNIEQEILIMQAMAYALAGKPRVAEIKLNSILSEKKIPSKLHPLHTLTKGWIALQRKDYQAAIGYFMEVVGGKQDTFPAAYWGLAEAYLSLGQLKEAEDYALKARDLAPDDPQSHVLMGEIYFAERRYTDAEKEYKEAIRLRPDHATAHLGLGKLFLRHTRYSDARKAFEDALRVDNFLVEAHVGMVYAYLGEKDYAAARRYIEQHGWHFLSGVKHYLFGLVAYMQGECERWILYPGARPECQEAYTRLKEYLGLAATDCSAGIIPAADSVVWRTIVAGLSSDAHAKVSASGLSSDAHAEVSALCKYLCQIKEVSCENDTSPSATVRSNCSEANDCEQLLIGASPSGDLSVIWRAYHAHRFAKENKWEKVLEIFSASPQATAPFGARTLYMLAQLKSGNKEASDMSKDTLLCREEGYLRLRYIVDRRLTDPLTPELERTPDLPELVPGTVSKAECFYYLGEMALQRKDTQKAISYFERIFSTEAGEASEKSRCSGAMRLAEIHLERQEAVKAEKALGRAEDCRKDERRLKLLKVWLLYVQGDTIKADTMLCNLFAQMSPNEQTQTFRKLRKRHEYIIQQARADQTTPPPNTALQATPFSPSSPTEKSPAAEPIKDEPSDAPSARISAPPLIDRGGSPSPSHGSGLRYSSGYYTPTPSSNTPNAPTSSLASGRQSAPARTLSLGMWIDTLYEYLSLESDTISDLVREFRRAFPGEPIADEVLGLYYLMRQEPQNAITFLKKAYDATSPSEDPIISRYNWIEVLPVTFPEVSDNKLRRGMLLVGAYWAAGQSTQANNLLLRLLDEYKAQVVRYLETIMDENPEGIAEIFNNIADNHPILLTSLLTKASEVTPGDTRAFIQRLLSLEGVSGKLKTLLRGVLLGR